MKNKIRIIIFLVIFIMVSILYNSRSFSKNSEFKNEVIVRTVENFKNYKDVVRFFKLAAKRNISIVNLNVKQDEDDEIPSGYVFYNSSVAPVAGGYEKFDVLKDAIKEAHKRNIQLRAWIPQFHDQEAAKINPEWQMMFFKDGKVKPFMGDKNQEYFINPINENVQAYEEKIIQEILSKYDVDGIVLDWLRFDDYNMDLGNYTRIQYKIRFGYDPIDIDFSSSNTKRNEWNSWRSQIIAKYVKKIRNDVNAIAPNVSLGVYILPPEFKECGQDAELFSNQVDFLSPMSYYADWGYSPSWIYGKSGVLADTRKKSNGKIVIPTLDSWWSEKQYSKIYSGLRKNYPEISSISYFLYGKWTDDQLKKIQSR